MKKNLIQFASRLSFLALALSASLSFNSCSKDDDEPSLDEVLSEETTPIDFDFEDYHWEYQTMLFDYAGNNYVGSDTITRRSQCTLNLRQGKHKLVWIYGLDDWGDEPDRTEKSGNHYDPVAKTVTTYDKYGADEAVSYCEKNLEVTPYLMPVQKVEHTNHLTCRVRFYVTDTHPNLPMPVIVQNDYSSRYEKVGKVTGFPHIKTVALFSNHYEMMDEEQEHPVWTCSVNTYWRDNKNDKHDTFDYDNVADDFVMTDISGYYSMFCPLNGLDNIQLTAEVKGKNGVAIPTTKLPKFSIKRGYTTILRGPLYSGSTSDWTVEMIPYDD